MRLFLVRHGESVDNVAGLYAGSRDSPLTNHGVLQARRLGTHLAGRAASIGPVRYIFSSNLQRASTTAQAILDAQPTPALQSTTATPRPSVVQLPELREKDFGSGEGKRFGARTESDQSDSEPQEAMRIRVDRFIEEHLTAAMVEATSLKEKSTIVVVAHGIILNVLLKAILSKFAPKELLRLASLGDKSTRSEFLASWSNTGYLEMLVENNEDHAPNLPSGQVDQTETEALSTDLEHPVTPGFKLRVTALNCIEHLQGLKKTRGGIGSAKFDNKQKTMDAFFVKAAKKPKLTKDSDG